MTSLPDLPPAQLGLDNQSHDASAEVPEREPSRLRAARLVSDHFDFIWRLVRRLGLSPQDADDTAQQVFMIATQKLNTVTAGGERTYLYGVALRVVSNFKRKAHRHREAGEPELADFCSAGVAPDEAAAMSRARTLLDEVLHTLPEELARVFILASIEQLELSEIAQLEGIPQGTVASRLRRARVAFTEGVKRSGQQSPFRHE